MKWMIASDIHGSAYYCEKILKAFKAEEADRLLLLGDLLYHGPRNDLPKDYDPKKVFTMLNEYADAIIGVRGNCDAEIDQAVLDFPMMSDYSLLTEGKHLIFATHGHIYGLDRVPKLQAGDVLLCGHIHVSMAEKLGKLEELGKLGAGLCGASAEAWYLNPGSASIPKEETPHGYMVLQNGTFCWKTFDGEIYRSLEL